MLTTIKDTLSRIQRAASSAISPAPMTWEEFKAQLKDLEAAIGKSGFANNFERFSSDPQYAAHFERLTMARGTATVWGFDASTVLAQAREDGVIHVFTRSIGMGTVDWQSKPDGTTYRGYGFRDLQQFNQQTGVNLAVSACLDQLAQRPGLQEIAELAKTSYLRDVEIFRKDPGTLDNLIYK